MSWDKGSVLSCDTPGCKGRLDIAVNRVSVIAFARAKGWRIFDGRSQTGKEINSHICPECGGTARSKLPPPPPKLQEDEPLF